MFCTFVLHLCLVQQPRGTKGAGKEEKNSEKAEKVPAQTENCRVCGFQGGLMVLVKSGGSHSLSVGSNSKLKLSRRGQEAGNAKKGIKAAFKEGGVL